MPCHNIKRLSATDISALASMKNVAKCDTWCELQNPVNHRVFERKLRPRLLAEGTSAWASRIATPPTTTVVEGRMMVSRASPGAVGLNKEPKASVCRGDRWRTRPRPWNQPVAHTFEYRARRTHCCRLVASQTLRPQVRRGYPLNLSISISGGKETYKDSPSNGERTGNSPALKSDGLAARIVVWRSVLCGGPGPSPLERGAREGESPVVPGPCRSTRRCHRVGLFENAAPSGR